MSDDLFSSLEPIVRAGLKPAPTETCALCIAATGEYNWSNLCCRARFITGLPGINWRRGWMARWKARETPDFYTAIERAVKAVWKDKTGAAHG